MQTLEFYRIFEIPKIKITLPGRDIDDNGDICSWYVEEVYPDIEPFFFELLDYYNSTQEELYVMELNLTRDNLVKILLTRLIDLFKSTQNEEIKQDIQIIFEEV